VGKIKVLFVAGFGPITRDQKTSKKLYADALGISFEEMANGYLITEDVAGVNHFALWPLSQAAESCVARGLANSSSLAGVRRRGY